MMRNLKPRCLINVFKMSNQDVFGTSPKCLQIETFRRGRNLQILESSLARFQESVEQTRIFRTKILSSCLFTILYMVIGFGIAVAPSMRLVRFALVETIRTPVVKPSP